MIEEGSLSSDRLFQLSSKSCSRANFVVQFLTELFEPSELEGKNIAKKKGKEKVDPARISDIKDYVERI